MDIQKFYRNVTLNGNNTLSMYTGPIINNLDAATEQAHNCFKNAKIDEGILEKRNKIAQISEEFHVKADTMTDRVASSIKLMKSKENVLLIESAHQPNLFPYAGMVVKPLVAHLIAEKLRETGIPVVEIFGVLDRNDLIAGWTRRTYLPDQDSRDGILILRKKLESQKLIFIAVPKPDSFEIISWKDSLVTWVKRNRKAINRLCREEIGADLINDEDERSFFERIDEIFDLLKEIAEKADNYGEFNSFFLSYLINVAWDCPALFIPYSKSMHVFGEEIRRIIDCQAIYVKSHNEHRRKVMGDVDVDFGEQSSFNVPFWYVCDCGSKIRLSIEGESLKGKCSNCIFEVYLERNRISEHLNNLDFQAISSNLVFFEALRPSIYVTGWGAMPYTLVAKGIADDLSMFTPLIVPFKLGETFYGLSKIRSVLELKNRKIPEKELMDKIEALERALEEVITDKKVRGEVKIELRYLKAIMNTLKCNQSILDNWINQSISETGKEWAKHIMKEEFGNKWTFTPAWVYNADDSRKEHFNPLRQCNEFSV